MTTIDLTPTPSGYAATARMFAETILGDVRSQRKSDDRALLVELMKIAGELRVSDPALLAHLLVAIEQDETPASFPGRLAEAMGYR